MFKEIPSGEDNKHGSVSCFCDGLAVGTGDLQRTGCLHRAHSAATTACTFFTASDLSVTSTPSKLSTISPLTPTPVKANTAEVFT